MSGGLTFVTHGRLTVGVYGEGLIMRIGAAGMALLVPGCSCAVRYDGPADARDHRRGR
jgi:hypothetical protein